jgi:hypothetical protein
MRSCRLAEPTDKIALDALRPGTPTRFGGTIIIQVEARA